MNDTYRNIKFLSIGIFVLCAIAGKMAFIVVVTVFFLFTLVRPYYYLPLLFFSGSLKMSPVAKHFPMDITLLSLILFTCFFLWNFIRKPILTKNVLPVTVLLVVMATVVTISCFTTVAPVSYIMQSGIFILIFYIPLAFMIINLPPAIDHKEMMFAFLYATFILGYAWVGVGFHNEIAHFRPPQLKSPLDLVSHSSAFGEDYMAFSFFLVCLVPDCFVDLFYYRRRFLLNGLLLIVFSFLIFNTPARGLTLGLLISLTLLVLPFFSLKNKDLLIRFSVVAMGLVTFFLVYYNFMITEERKNSLIRLTTFSSGTSIQNRIQSVMKELPYWKENLLFGTGVNSVGYYSQNPGLYAHNLFLETVFEYGLIGGIPFLIFFAICLSTFYKLYKYKPLEAKTFPITWFCAIFVVLFIFTMFSNTMGNMRQQWITMAMIIWVAGRLKQLSFSQLRVDHIFRLFGK